MVLVEALVFPSVPVAARAEVAPRRRVLQAVEAEAISAVTQAELAKVVHSSQSRIAKMEAGDPSVTLDLLIRTLLALGASERDVARMIAAGSSRRAA